MIKKITLKATKENLDQALSFIDTALESLDCSPKTQMQIDIAVEELYVNIANYAYAPGEGDVCLTFESRESPSEVLITFEDSGIPYDPLKKPDPDVTLSAEDRQIGGLGIYMVKKSMDGMEYKYEDGKNILTIRKLY